MNILKYILAILFVCMGCQSKTNIRVIVKNADPKLLDSVVVFVTASSYQLGKIESGDSATVNVFPRGESHVEIEFTSLKNGRRRLVVDSYFETGYTGFVRATINADSIVNIQQSIVISK
jgi:hypothetical protein